MSKLMDDLSNSLSKVGKKVEETAKSYEAFVIAKLKELKVTAKNIRANLEEYSAKSKLAKAEDSRLKAIHEKNVATEESAESSKKAAKAEVGLGKAIDGVTGGILSSFKAILSNPIGAVMAGLVAAFQLFSKAIKSTEDGANKFAAIGAGISDIWSKFITMLSDMLMPVMDILINNFGLVTTAASAFGSIMKAAILPILKSVQLQFKGVIAVVSAASKALKGDFAGAKDILVEFKDEAVKAAVEVKDAFVEAGLGVAKLVKEGYAAATGDGEKATNKVLNDAVRIRLEAGRIAKEKRAQLLLDAKIESLSAKQLANFEKAGASLEERNTALNEYIKLEEQRGKNALKQLENEIANEKERQKLSNSDITDAETLNKLEIDHIKIKQEMSQKEREYNIKRKSLYEEEKAIYKAHTEFLLTKSEELNSAKLELEKDSLQKSLAIQELANDAVLNSINQREEAALTLIGDNEEKSAAIREQFEAERQASALVNSSKRLKIEADYQKSLEELLYDLTDVYLLADSERLALQRDAELLNLEEKLADHENYEMLKAGITAKYAEEIRVAKRAESEFSKFLNNEEVDRALDAVSQMQTAWITFADTRVEKEETALDELVTKRDTAAALGNASEVARLDKDIKEQEKAVKKAQKMQQAAAIAGVLVDTAGAIMGTWKGYASLGPFGTAAAIAQSIALVATAAAQIRAIKQASASQASDTGSSNVATKAQDIINQPPTVDTGIQQSIQAFIVEDSLAASRANIDSRNAIGEM